MDRQIQRHQLRQIVKDICIRDVTGELLYIVAQTVEKIGIKLGIVDGKDDTEMLERNYTNSFQMGYANHKSARPRMAISPNFRRLKIHLLYTTMMDIMRCTNM